MINKILSSKEEILIESADGTKFQLPTKDFPIPKNEGDRVEVEQLIEEQIKQVFPDEIVKVHIFRLDPLFYTMILSVEEPPEDWWVT
jgi:hypothetical protein